jgi:hypothetical protein
MTLREMMIQSIKESKFGNEFEENELENMEDEELMFNFVGVTKHESWESGYFAGYDAGYLMYITENGDDGMLKVQVNMMDDEEDVPIQ